MRMRAPWLEAKPVRSTNATQPASGGGGLQPEGASAGLCCIMVVPL